MAGNPPVQVAHTFAADALTSEEFGPQPGHFCFDLEGTFVGAFVVERKGHGSSVWIPLTASGTPVTFTAPATEVLTEPVYGTRYRMRCTSFGSGTPIGRLTQ